MAERPPSKQQGPAEHLLIKVILPKQGVERKVPAGASAPRPFRTVDATFRKSLSTRVRTLQHAIESSARSVGAVPVLVKLLSVASAKSHRPETLFSSKTCPIIGAGKLGEIYIRATPEGLKKIDSYIMHDKHRSQTAEAQLTKEISTIDTIEPVTPESRLDRLNPQDVLRLSPRKEDGFSTKVQLFDFVDAEDQQNLVSDFMRTCEQARIKVQRRGYSDDSQYYEAICRTVNDVETLSNIVGVRSIKRMPVIRSIRPQAAQRQSLPSGLPEPTDGIGNYPIVAVVDSGISDQIPRLNQWVIGRDSRVAANYRNPWHGTFIAGLLCWGKELNPTLRGVDSSPCAIFDLQVIPNDDPALGDTDVLLESELLQDLETALRAHANEIKVWNLSLSTDEVCSLDGFSSVAVDLDRLQEKYNVSFVISAGNYDQRPLLDYPRTGDQLARGRITTPADSVLGITVGSVAHVAHPNGGPREGEPSAFSRHGAGPNFIIKPDLVHFGGTCTTDGSQQHGVRSIDGNQTGEGLGTSFSAPLVARTLANIYHHVTPTPSPVLARAILTHHARDPRNDGRVPDTEENFLGFGLPPSIAQCLQCEPWTSTLVFEDQIRPGYYLEWSDFPYPPCLTRNGRYFGDIWMTVAFAPARNERWGTEYCETHIDASFGVYHRQKARSTGVVTVRFNGLVPPEHKNPGLLYESYQVEKLRKWAPVRTYFGSLGERGEAGFKWRLMVRLLTRHGVDASEHFRPQRFALIVTISDPNRTAPVYNDMAVGIRSRFKVENLALRAVTRIRAQAGQ